MYNSLNSLLREINAMELALDISKKALNVAKYNAKIQQIKNRIKFVNSDIDKFKLGTYDIILSNPPYIKNC